MRRISASVRFLPSYTVLSLLSLTSKIPRCSFASPPLKKARTRGMVSEDHVRPSVVICDGHMTSAVLGRPAVRIWMVPSAMNVFPTPHSATMRAALAWRRYLAVPVMASPCAGSVWRSSVATARAMDLWCSGVVGRFQRMRAPSSAAWCSQIVEGSLHRDTSWNLIGGYEIDCKCARGYSRERPFGSGNFKLLELFDLRSVVD